MPRAAPPAPSRLPLIGVTGRRWPARLLGTNVVSAVSQAEVDLHFADYSMAVTEAGGLMVGLSRVNSLHHQVVGQVGDGLVAAGRSPDGTVEALEMPGRPVLAVQWHPEALQRARPDAGFRWLMDEAAAFQESSTPE